MNNSGGTTNADIDDHHYSHLFCQPQKMSFGKLKELVTSQNPFCGHKVDLSCFNGLQELTISKYEGSMSLFSFSIARNLVTLRELYIRKCDEIVQVIKDEEDKAVSTGERNRLFPNLQELHLFRLPKLVSFCEWNCDVELPSLRFVNIRGCLNIKNFSLAPNLEDFRTDLNNYLEVGVKVPFDSLKQLDCCDEMVKLIKDDEEENAVSGDGQRTTLLFPKLQELLLFHLPELVSFCEWKCDVELPSLRDVFISCPNMKYFTLGSKQYLAREKENQENEKKGSGEDQENKAEIEEEQNS
ncbi:hypothetical protein C2S51_036203 [Perilla frutescens var. frutescens]|nr:hypothetical protein C2S51_036203 [Perilla frutescens var. frutescens]